jgi:hypothetical protein
MTHAIATATERLLSAYRSVPAACSMRRLKDWPSARDSRLEILRHAETASEV